MLERSVIRTIAQVDIGASSGIARAVLSYHEERHPLPYYLGELNDPPIRYRTNEEEKVQTSDRLIVRPVPAENWIILDYLPESIDHKQCKLSIVDVYGQTVYHGDITNTSSLSVSVSLWKPGVYIASILSGNRIISTKFVIE